MEREQIVLQVRQIVSDLTQWPIDKVTEASNFETDLGGNSIDMVEVVMHIEQEFAVTVSDEEFESWVSDITVEQIVDLVLDKCRTAL